MKNLKLLVFCQLSVLKKVYLVAEALNLTPSTVSFHIHSLEKELGVSLFYKQSGHFVLTEAGTQLLQIAQKIVLLQESAVDYAKSYQQGRSGRLRLGVSNLASHLYLPPVVDNFTAHYPHIQLSVTATLSPEIEYLVEHLKLDFGILVGSPKKNQALLYTELERDHLVLAFGQNHQFATRSQIARGAVIDEKILFHANQSSTKSIVEDWLQLTTDELDVILLDSITTIKKILAYGRTIAFISEALIADELEQGELLKYDFADAQLDRTIYLVRHKEQIQTPASQYFEQFLLSL